MNLEGRSGLITGGSRGLGLEIARRYAGAGARLVIAARNADALTCAADELRAIAGAADRVETVAGDVTRPEDVHAMVARALAAYGKVDILVNDAGMQGPIGPAETVDWAAWVRTVEVDLLGPVLLCREVLPLMKKQGYGKIVQISGGGATGPRPRFSAYAAAKAGVVRFVETLAGEVQTFGIDVNAIAPGALNTQMLDEMLAAGPELLGTEEYAKVERQRAQGGTPLSRGAELAVFLGSSASDGITGKLISAVWDPWKELPAHRDELNSTDVYALRRIVPKDRGLGWGNDK